MSNKRQSFAEVTLNKNALFPKKDQAIILSPYPGIPINEYIIALGNLIGPEKILLRERISNNRISVFLKSKEIVDQLLDNHDSINVWISPFAD